VTKKISALNIVFLLDYFKNMAKEV